MENYLLYLAAGRLLTWLLQVNGLTRPIFDSHPKLAELRACDMCLGFWVYLGLALFIAPPLMLFPKPVKLVVVAAMSTFLMHLLRLGWVSKFGGITVID